MYLLVKEFMEKNLRANSPSYVPRNTLRYIALTVRWNRFAECYIRTVKPTLFEYLHENNTTRLIDQLQNFVHLKNHKDSPKQVTKKDVLHLVSLSAKAKPVKKARFKIGDTARNRLKIPTFHKSYKIQFTEEIFEIVANPTLNPRKYTMKDKDGQII